jgi:hypothetical protein
MNINRVRAYDGCHGPIYVRAYTSTTFWLTNAGAVGP